MKKTTRIITPNVKSGYSNCFSLALSDNHGSASVNAVRYPSNKYVITSKNGAIPDIELDETTVDMLIEAKKQKERMQKIIAFFRDPKHFDPEILNNTNLLLSISRYIPSDAVYIDAYLYDFVDKDPDIRPYIRHSIA